MNRILDLLIILLILPFIVTFLGTLSLLILIIDRFPPFFKTYRIGKSRKKFRIYKLQAMKPPKPGDEFLDPKKDQERITKLGKFFRNRGWDELPQLLNIFTGDMTFIGPRPLMQSMYEKMKKGNPNKTDLINKWWSKRQEVTPGLSGWHQIHLLDHNIIKKDLEFLENPSFEKKLKILFISILIMIIGKNRYFGKKIPDTYEYNLNQ